MSALRCRPLFILCAATAARLLPHPMRTRTAVGPLLRGCTVRSVSLAGGRRGLGGRHAPAVGAPPPPRVPKKGHARTGNARASGAARRQPPQRQHLRCDSSAVMLHGWARTRSESGRCPRSREDAGGCAPTATHHPTTRSPASSECDCEGTTDGRGALWQALPHDKWVRGRQPHHPHHPQAASCDRRPWQQRSRRGHRTRGRRARERTLPRPTPKTPKCPSPPPPVASPAPLPRGAAPCCCDQPQSEGGRGCIGCRGPVRDGYVARLLRNLVPAAQGFLCT